jgi:CRISPR/Cas system Type II protein with McrA/HNH and RuvC-like nuclease domain
MDFDEITNSKEHNNLKIIKLRKYSFQKIKRCTGESMVYIVDFLKMLKNKRRKRSLLKQSLNRIKYRDNAKIHFYKTKEILLFHPLSLKLQSFFKKYSDNKTPNEELIKEFIQRYGVYPRCELTGKLINLNLSNSYELDHIIPISKGGESTFENMQIVLSSVNRMKAHYDLDEFITICNLVAKKYPID